MAEANVSNLDRLRERWEEADPHPLRAMVATVVAALWGQANAQGGALTERAFLPLSGFLRNPKSSGRDRVWAEDAKCRNN